MTFGVGVAMYLATSSAGAYLMTGQADYLLVMTLWFWNVGLNVGTLLRDYRRAHE